MTKTELKIDGMMCDMCEAHVNDAIRRALPVKKVRADHKKGTAEILSAEPLDQERLFAAVEETGYRVLGVTQSPYEPGGLSRLFSRKK